MVRCPQFEPDITYTEDSYKGALKVYGIREYDVKKTLMRDHRDVCLNIRVLLYLFKICLFAYSYIKGL